MISSRLDVASGQPRTTSRRLVVAAFPRKRDGRVKWAGPAPSRAAFNAAVRPVFQWVMDVSWQPDLFSSRGEVAVDAAFRAGRRTGLDARSWVEVFPGWLAGANELFQRLAEAVPWQAHYRWLFRQRFLEPRLTAEYRQLADIPHPALVAACDALSAHYGVRYDNLWLNLYRGGEDSTGWHRDRFSCRRPECIVPVLTLGATRRFLLKPRVGGPSVAFQPSSGDLVVMGGRCQDEWVHSVPKAPGAQGARISVNFQSSEQARRPEPED